MIPLRGARTRNGWPWVTLGLILLNSLIFLYTLKIGPKTALSIFWQGGAVPARLSQVKFFTSRESLWLVATVFISLFLHAGWFHLLGNMWFLWLFGEGLERELGPWRYLGFYLFAGYFACLFHVLAASSLTAPLIGASGAIAGVMGAYLVRLPQNPILTLVFWRLKPELTEIPAFVWLALWLVLQFYGLKQGGPVAWMAHLGGFAIGLFGVSLFVPLAANRAPLKAPSPAGSRAAGRRRGTSRKRK